MLPVPFPVVRVLRCMYYITVVANRVIYSKVKGMRQRHRFALDVNSGPAHADNNSMLVTIAASTNL